MDVDAALLKLGTFNRWRMLTYSLVCTSVTVAGCWHMMVIVFTGGEPVHHCKLRPGETLNGSIPLTEVVQKGAKKWRYSQCERYVTRHDHVFSNVTSPCDNGWDYDDTEFKSTIVTEWDLVCDKNYLVETSQSVFNMGVMVGAIVFTSLADKVGRKPVHLTCQYCMLVVGVIIAFAPNYITFVILRFLQGAVREGAGLVGIVMACELFPAIHRTFAGAALELFWATAWMALALIAYFIRDWRHLQLAVTLPALWTICLFWLLPESVPWLAANNRIKEAEDILHRAGTWSGGKDTSDPQHPEVNPPTVEHLHERPIADDDTEDAQTTDSINVVDDLTKNKGSVNNNGVAVASADTAQATTSGGGRHARHGLHHAWSRVRWMCRGCKKVKGAGGEHLKTQQTCLDLLRSRTMILYTFIMCSLWFASGVVYFGLSLSTSSLAGDKYVNFFLSGAVEAPAYGLTVIVLQRFGRRWPLFLFHTTAGIVLFVNIFIPNETASGTDLTTIIITLTMIGKFSMTAAFGTCVLYAPEIYPTNLRNFGFGMASVWARIGGMIAPFFAYIGKTNNWIPSMAFTVTALFTGILALFLPETLNRPLPETIEEIEGWSKEKKIWKWSKSPSSNVKKKSEEDDTRQENMEPLVELGSSSSKQQ